MAPSPRYVVIGGGIIGLAVADRLVSARPGSHVTVVEKENTWAAHQTGRNSGVIHSGLYYAPGSLKARMCRAGAQVHGPLRRGEGIAHEICGKLVVATSQNQLPGLRRLYERGLANGLAVTQLSPAEAEGARAACPRPGRVARAQHRHHRLRRGVPGPGPKPARLPAPT